MSYGAEDLDNMTEDDWEDLVSEKMDRGFYDGDDDLCGEGVEFADPSGTSALRAAGPGNPRNLPCPTCKSPNRLTRKDVDLGYQCDSCADRVEQGFDC